MKNIIISNKTTLMRFLMVALFILLVGSVFAQIAGDYRSTASQGLCSDLGTWSYYNGTGWVNATQIPPSSFPLGNTIYLDHAISCGQNFELSGNMVIGEDVTLHGVDADQQTTNAALHLINGAHFEITDTGTVEYKSIQIDRGCKLTNDGTIRSGVPGATIKINFDWNSEGHATLVNNGSIILIDDDDPDTHNLQLYGEALLISKPNGSISGTGSISSAQYVNAWFEIANAGGFIGNEGAVRLSGSNDFKLPNIRFNGTGVQHTGILPSPIFGLVIDNPKGVKLDHNVDVHAQSGFVTVNSGATLDMGPFIMKSKGSTEAPAYWQSAVFTLEEGATLKTQHPEGASLEATNGLITKGCIQMNTANYNGQIIVIDDTLPVTLSSFTATIAGPHKVRISWMTASETNCLGYQIWRSDNTDLVSATCVTPMIQATNSSQGGYYAFTDTDLYQEGTYYYWLEDISFNYESQFHGYIQLSLEFQGDNHTPEVVERTGFKANYPNPFNPSTTLRYGLSEDSDVTIRFYNQRGQLIDSRQLPNQKKGRHSLVWNAQDLGLSSGIYFARLLSQNGNDTLKITLSE